ncbi:hypothetical protein [Alishewanella sp. HL-SH05]|uniref:hypothetical protein n=1 Tax=Alishewanella sp. HL-SH05 TaxID=3461145 RepID=UPI0040430033
MSVDNGERSPAEWVAHLFKLKLSQHKYLKDKLTSLLRNRVVLTKEILEPGRKTMNILIPESQRCALRNAVLLNGFIDDPAKVNRVFNDINYRHDIANLLVKLFAGNNELTDITIARTSLDSFFTMLLSNDDLKAVQLPNPFNVLPQTVYNQGVSMMQSIMLKGVTLGEADAMALYYLTGDIERAHTLALKFKAKSEGAELLRQKIISDYKQALNFQKNFSFFMN